MWTIVIVVIVSLAITVGLYYGLRKLTAFLAKKEKFLASPPVNRVMRVVRNGMTVRYIGNTKGFGRHIDSQTGKMKTGEETIRSFLWYAFGVIWIGFDSIFKYHFSKTWVDETGKYKEEVVPDASTIFCDQTYELQVIGKTQDNIEVSLRLQISRRLEDASLSFKYDDWKYKFDAPIKSTSRDFVAAHKFRVIQAQQYEGQITGHDHSEFVELMLSLNEGTIGNPGLPDDVGHRLISVNVLSINILDPKIKEAFEAEARAEEAGKAKVIEAKKLAEVAEEEKKATITKAEGERERMIAEATGRKALGDAENTITAGAVAALGGKAEHVVAIKQSENLGKLTGTLVLGKGSPIILGSQNNGGAGV